MGKWYCRPELWAASERLRIVDRLPSMSADIRVLGLVGELGERVSERAVASGAMGARGSAEEDSEVRYTLSVVLYVLC